MLTLRRFVFESGAPRVGGSRPWSPRQGRVVCCSLAGNELLATIDVVGRTRERSVSHHMRGERCNVGRADDAPDGERGAQLTAALIELVAKQRCRQGCVDEAGGDQIDSDGVSVVIVSLSVSSPLAVPRRPVCARPRSRRGAPSARRRRSPRTSGYLARRASVTR